MNDKSDLPDAKPQTSVKEPVQHVLPEESVPLDLSFIDTINALARQARTSWLTLLTFLAFIGVTLLSVQDIDFFVPSRQTDLPLIGISIPTKQLFWIAPFLTMALFAQLHFLLLKLWEATSPSRTPATLNGTAISNIVAASFITDLALANRKDGALQVRPLRWATRWVTGLLIFAATPGILAWFWWRSMPAQEPLLTILGAGIPLCITLYVALRSYIRMRRLQQDRLPENDKWRPARWGSGLALLAILSGWGYLRTEFSLAAYLMASPTPEGESRMSSENLQALQSNAPFVFLASADLSNAVFVATPSDWPTYDAMYLSFRQDWCSDRDIPLLACAERSSDAGPTIAAARAGWCSLNAASLPSENSCTATFAHLENLIADNWQSTYRANIAALPTVDLSEVSLRGADLGGAELQGANLWEAELQGANLGEAELQGANLGEAELQGAYLVLAELQGAYLVGAELQGANLWGAELQGANLGGGRSCRGPTS